MEGIAMKRMKKIQKILITLIIPILLFSFRGVSYSCPSGKGRNDGEKSIRSPLTPQLKKSNPIPSELELGMTKEAVLERYARPARINITHGSFGTHEQWVYERYRGNGLFWPYLYLFFENGKLTAWHENQ
jgi:hypothetical protein